MARLEFEGHAKGAVEQVTVDIRDLVIAGWTGRDVTAVKPGDRVAVSPSLPCGACRYCLEGLPNQCLDMRFMGSAMRFPHMQGGFAESVTVDARQAVPIPDDLTLAGASYAPSLNTETADSITR